MTSNHNCVKCSKNVSSRMHAISCDNCERWQHRKCETGISLEDYRLMCKGKLQLEWKCYDCLVKEQDCDMDQESGTEKSSNVQECPTVDFPPVFDSSPDLSDYFEDFTDMNFEIEQEFGEQFILEDIKFEGMRHLIFVKKTQLNLIRESRRWFIGGTYKLVQHPFLQLLTIHRFIRSGTQSKQVPIVYILLSRTRKSDYIKVLSCLKQHLCEPLVECFMLDFVTNIWEAVREVFPGKRMKGCNFQWTTQVYRQIQKAGLTADYKKRGNTYNFLRKLMCLPYLPTEHIQPAFVKLRELAVGAKEPVKRIISYIDTAWISGSQWGAENWSVYGHEVRTNNDVKGWQSKITGRILTTLPVYDLTELLYKEAKWVDIEVQYVKNHISTRTQRKKCVQINKDLARLWDDYAKNRITTSGLLREVSDITGSGR